MVHAYDSCLLDGVQWKLAGLFRVATEREHMGLDEFMEKFISSGMAEKFETANPIYVLGKTENELTEIILGRELAPPGEGRITAAASWTGYVLAYAQWYLSMPYREITDKFPCSSLEGYAYGSEGESIPKIMAVIKERISYKCPLQEYREERGFTQEELAKIADVPVEDIIAFEAKEKEISEAPADAVYRLAKALSVTMEELVCWPWHEKRDSFALSQSVPYLSLAGLYHMAGKAAWCQRVMQRTTPKAPGPVCTATARDRWSV